MGFRGGPGVRLAAFRAPLVVDVLAAVPVSRDVARVVRGEADGAVGAVLATHGSLRLLIRFLAVCAAPRATDTGGVVAEQF